MATRGSDSHRTHVRGRKSRWEATCSCGWSEGTVSGFGAWAAARRHADHSEGSVREPVEKRSDVRVLGREPPRQEDDQPRR